MLLNFDNFEGSTLEESYGFVHNATIEVGTGPGGHNCVKTTALGDSVAQPNGLYLSNGIYEGVRSTSRTGVKGVYSDFTVADSAGWPLIEVWQGDWVVGVYVNGTDLDVYKVGGLATDPKVALFHVPTIISPGTFKRVDLKWTVSSLDESNQLNFDGSVQLFVDLVSVGSVVNQQLGYALPEGFVRDVHWNVVVFNPHGRGALCYLLDGSGTRNNTVLPDGLDIITRYPTAGNGKYIEMTPSAAVNHGALVDETVNDGDTTYLAVTGNAKKDSFVFNPFPTVAPKTVHGLKHVASMKKLDSGNRRARSFMRRNGANQYAVADVGIGVGYYDWLQYVYEVDPFTNGNFTVPNLTITEFGLIIG